MIKTITIFCGSKTGNLPIYADAAKQLADVMSKAGIGMVYGGAKVGLMGIIADQMLQHKMPVIGVIPQSLVDVELAHQNLTELHVVETMHKRKQLMADLADAFIMMPGGSGSLDEFFEIFTWGQLGYHKKPCGILNVASYYDGLLKFLDHAVAQGFLQQCYREMIIVDSDPAKLVQRCLSYQPPLRSKWDKGPIGDLRSEA